MSSDFRHADPADAAAIAALVQSAFRGDSSREGWTTEADLLEDTRIGAPEVAELLADPRRATFVLEDDDGLLATCQVEDCGAGVARFGLFAVRPRAQGAGVGRRLVHAAAAYARAGLHAAVLELQVLEPRSELIAWYERLGFARTGERRPFPPEAAAIRPPLVDGLEFVVLAKPLA